MALRRLRPSVAGRGLGCARSDIGGLCKNWRNEVANGSQPSPPVTLSDCLTSRGFLRWPSRIRLRFAPIGRNHLLQSSTENRELRTDNCISVVVIGAGAFGRNHARVYHELAQQGEAARLAAIVDTDLGRASGVAQPYGLPVFASVEELLAKAKPDAASVAVPTVAHVQVAR